MMGEPLSALVCPRCGLAVVEPIAGPCGDCRNQLNRIYADRNRVRIAALAHLVPEDFNLWLNFKVADESSVLHGITPWEAIDAGFTNEVIALVKTFKRSRPLEDD